MNEPADMTTPEVRELTDLHWVCLNMTTDMGTWPVWWFHGADRRP